MSRLLRLAEPRPAFPGGGVGALTAGPPGPADSRLGVADMLLLIIFMIGIYTGYTIQISTRIPFPSAPSGVAGLFLLWRRRNDIQPAQFGALLFVIFLYVGSIFSATDIAHLGKRFTGLVQITYSLIISYALFLTVLRAKRAQIAHLFLALGVVILIGCLLEDYAGLRPISDAFRHAVYKALNVYDADLRDQILYGRIRPKLFTSEPSAVTFAYTLFGFVWLMTTRTRFAALKYLVLMALGIVVMPGPTLLLMIPLLVAGVPSHDIGSGFHGGRADRVRHSRPFGFLGAHARYRPGPGCQLLLSRHRPGDGRAPCHVALPVRRRRSDRRNVHRQRSRQRLYALGGVLLRLGYFRHRQRAHQLFLAALDLSRFRLGHDRPSRPHPVAQNAVRAQRAVLL